MRAIHLPFGQPAQAPWPFLLRNADQPSGSGRTHELERPRILIVEDDFLLALRLEMLLSEAGYAIVGPVARLDEALGLVGREDIDAAILDVDLNGATVFPAAEALARQGKPFLFLTAYVEDEVYPAHLRARPRLGKPQDDQGILSALRKLLIQD